MKCPVCGEKINELDEVCPHCKTNLDEVESKNELNGEVEPSSHADILKIFAIFNLILSIGVAIFIWVKLSTIEVIGEYSYTLQDFKRTTETNGYAIAGGFAIIYGGIILYFALMTIVDIYYKVENNSF